MTREEAAAELGVDADATADDVRRAYLRLLKTRKPEVDAEGFQRLRAAYERMRGTLRVAPAPVAVVEDDGEGEGEAADEGDEDDDDDDLPKLQSQMESEAWVDAADTLRALYASSLRGEIALGVLVRPSLRVRLALHEMGEGERAARLGRAFRRWAKATNEEARLLPGAIQHVNALVREMDGLPPDFPLAVRAAIARAIRRGDLESALPELLAFRGAHARDAARAADALQPRFPLLARAFVVPLTSGRSALVKVAASGSALVGILVLIFNLTSQVALQPSAQEKRRQAESRVVDEIERVEQDLAARNCAQARRHMFGLRSSLGTNAPPGASARAEALSARVADLCKETGETP